MLHAVDDLDWETVRSSFTTEVEIDYTSLWGGEPETLTADQLIDRWRQLLPGFDATQHLIGPVAVTEADELTASCTINVRATIASATRPGWSRDARSCVWSGPTDPTGESPP